RAQALFGQAGLTVPYLQQHGFVVRRRCGIELRGGPELFLFFGERKDFEFACAMHQRRQRLQAAHRGVEVETEVDEASQLVDADLAQAAHHRQTRIDAADEGAGVEVAVER